MLFFKKRTGKSGSGNKVPAQWQDLKWGISSPQMLRLSDGIGKIRAFGSFKCEICDPDLLMNNGCDPADSKSIVTYINYLQHFIVRAFIATLAAESRSMTAEQLLDSTDILSEATLRKAGEDLSLKGITLTEFKVERILRA